MTPDLNSFEASRASLLALAYRMLGDFGRAEDLVQEAWLRWSRCEEDVESPRAYLIKVVTRLCLNELESARARREQVRGDRLPEPVDLEAQGLQWVEALDRISMAFLVMLQRLSPAERAVLLLHDVLDFSHPEIGELLGRSDVACRQLLKRAREHVAQERGTSSPSRDEHERMLRAFVNAALSGDAEQLVSLLAKDAMLVADAGPQGGTFGRVRNISEPISGAVKVAAFVAAVTPQGVSGLSTRECDLNGEPAIILIRDGKPQSALMLSIVKGRIQSVFIQADPARMGRVLSKVC